MNKSGLGTTIIDLKGEEPPPLEHVSRLKRFLHHDMVGPAFLLAAALAALVIANTPWQDQYHHIWETTFGFAFGTHELIKPLHLWVNDGLMAIFFFLIGLEIKRELLVGELASFRKAIFPATAALGGMIGPAIVYIIINYSHETRTGWGIPMATDIAFAAGCIALLKKRVPTALMVFLIALAIVDDLGAVTVIALFYTQGIDMQALLLGSCVIGLSFFCGRLGVRKTYPYVIFGIIVWLAFLTSGVHATVAGVLLAFTIPSDARYRGELFESRVNQLVQRFHQAEGERQEEIRKGLVSPRTETKRLVNARQQNLIRSMQEECHHVEAPLQRIEYNLEPFCVFFVMPIFAFANSGLTIDFAHLRELLMQPATLGVFFGLILGKQLGIMGAAWASVKSGIAHLPAGVRWSQIYGVSWLAGIGFTMSLFIAELAFPEGASEAAHEHLAQAKIGVFLASLIAGVVGLLILRITCPMKSKNEQDSAAAAH